MVRRAQEEDALHQRRPVVAPVLRLVQRAAHHQATHAVRQHRDLLQRHRPGLLQRLQPVGQLQPVARDMAAAVVVQVQQRAVAFGRQRRAVVVAVAPPLPGVHAQAVQQQQHARPRLRQRLGQRVGPQREGLAVVAQRHGDGQRVAGGGEVVAEHAVEHRDQRLALGRRRWHGTRRLRRTQQRDHLTQQRVQAAADQPRDAADAAVDEPGDTACGLLRRLAQRPRRAQDVVVQVFHQVGQAERGVHRQAAGAAQVAGQYAGGLPGQALCGFDHAGIMPASRCAAGGRCRRPSDRAGRIRPAPRQTPSRAPGGIGDTPPLFPAPAFCHRAITGLPLPNCRPPPPWP